MTMDYFEFYRLDLVYKKRTDASSEHNSHAGPFIRIAQLPDLLGHHTTHPGKSKDSLLGRGRRAGILNPVVQEEGSGSAGEAAASPPPFYFS